MLSLGDGINRKKTGEETFWDDDLVVWDDDLKHRFETVYWNVHLQSVYFILHKLTSILKNKT